jgi:hypothetical protein
MTYFNTSHLPVDDFDAQIQLSVNASPCEKVVDTNFARLAALMMMASHGLSAPSAVMFRAETHKPD